MRISSGICPQNVRAARVEGSGGAELRPKIAEEPTAAAPQQVYESRERRRQARLTPSDLSNGGEDQVCQSTAPCRYARAADHPTRSLTIDQ